MGSGKMNWPVTGSYVRLDRGGEQVGPVKACVGELGGKPRDGRAEGRDVVQCAVELLPDLGERWRGRC
jgi:hypothetical protein